MFPVLQMGDSDSLAEELGEVSGFIDVVYREMCAAHAAELAALEERKVKQLTSLVLQYCAPGDGHGGAAADPRPVPRDSVQTGKVCTITLHSYITVGSTWRPRPPC